jgi:hypothetical protein
VRLVDPTLAAARTRAALAYAEIAVKDSGRRVGISYSKMTRIVSATKPRGWHDDEMAQIAQACNVPHWFLEHGWIPPVEALDEGEIAARLRAVEAEVSLLLEAAGAQAPGGELGHRLEAALTSRRDHAPPGSPEEPGALPGNGRS